MRTTLLAGFYLATGLAYASSEAGSNLTSSSFALYSLLGANLPTGTCNAETPCVNGACCSVGGICGYSPTECGNGNCTSNCDAKAQCGPYAEKETQACPLRVCCSQYGFCGSTDDFCDTGCQKGYGSCGEVKRPRCASNGGQFQRTIGYYESWASFRKCQAIRPKDLDVNGYTHVNFAFLYFDLVQTDGPWGSTGPTEVRISPMGSHSEDLYSEFTSLKDQHYGLQTWVSIGGWAFSDPGPTRTSWSDMTKSPRLRDGFIQELMRFMTYYGFDGVDLDWEYPQAGDRDGIYEDYGNYVKLVQEMYLRFRGKFGISVTLPASYWYLQHFDVASMERYVDWFNLMSYDMHGVWDKESQEIGPYIAPDTNVTEIDLGLDLLWRAGIDPAKITMGLALYGRSFKLKDHSCNEPNGVCQFVYENGIGATPGPCSDASGILDLSEIKSIISEKGLEPTMDSKAAVKWITWDSDQWVSYDDEETLELKRSFAKGRCLGGTMVWAMDQVDQHTDSQIAQAVSLTDNQRETAKYLQRNSAAAEVCTVSGCDETCPDGMNKVSEIIGQYSGFGTSGERCPTGQTRYVCCADGTSLGSCAWNGYRGGGLSCFNGCPLDTTEIVKSSGYLEEYRHPVWCSGASYASLCCSNFIPPPSGVNLQSGEGANDGSEGDDSDPIMAEFGDRAKAIFESGAEQVALDVAATSLCTAIVVALEAVVDGIELFIPVLGEIIVAVEAIAESIANRFLIRLCTQLVEKEGKAAIRAIENRVQHRTVTSKPSSTRPPESSHTSAKTSSESCLAKRDDDDCRKRKKPVRTTTAISDDTRAAHTYTITAKCDKYPQPCWHYSSVISANPGYGLVTCPYRQLDAKARTGVDEYNEQHDRDLVADDADCQADEWPPAKLAEINDGRELLEGGGPTTPTRKQYIRLLDSAQNNRAGKLFIHCPRSPVKNDVDEEISLEAPKRGGNLYTQWTKVKAVFTRDVYTIEWENNADPGDGDDGLRINPCAKLDGVGTMDMYPGFALLNDDPWFKKNPDAVQYQVLYANDRVGKRDLLSAGPDDIIVVGSNSSRRPTDGELRKDFGLIRCNEDCQVEFEELSEADPELMLVNTLSSPAVVDSESTMTATPTTAITAPAVSEGLGVLDKAHFPRQTQL